MKKDSLLSFFDRNSLNIIFGFVIFFTSGLPLIFSLKLIYSNFQHEKKMAESQNLKIKAVSSQKLKELITDIRSKLKIVSQNQEVIDVLSINSKTLVFFENRVYGRISEAIRDSPIKIEWAIYSNQSDDLVLGSKKIDFNPKTSGILLNLDLLVKNHDIYISEAIRLDDQNLAGPNSLIKGYVFAKIDLADIQALIPKIKKINPSSSGLDGNNFEIEMVENPLSISYLIFSFSVILFSLLFSIGFGLFLFRDRILVPLKTISKKLQAQQNDKIKNEIAILEKAIESHIENLKIQEFEKHEKDKLKAANLLASQVAHDIRSPLTALNMVIGTIDRLPEDKRILVRNAIQRINDIANDLLSKGKSSTVGSKESSNSPMDKESESTVMLSSLIDILISEKRIQFRDKIGVQIGVELSNSYGLFAKLPANELKRVLSNLLNNSVEAFHNEVGKIFVTLEKQFEMVKIQIIDNGKGIPPAILAQLGTMGISSGKQGTSSGSGLGIHHAIKFIESVGGSIDFSNASESVGNTGTSNSGTKVTMLIPQSQPPVWFVKYVAIPTGGKLIALDDDQSIHSIWQGRLSSLQGESNHVKLVSFTSAEIFRNWVSAQNGAFGDCVFLIDYELLGQKVIGLDLVEEFNLQKFSILVSSRYDEKNVYERCKRLGVRIIPKAAAGLVPFEITAKVHSIDAVLIDDDPLIHMTWKLSAEQNGKTFAGFRNHFDFLENMDSFPKSTPIILDSQLENGIKGEVIAKEIFDLGFVNVFIGTGLSRSEFIDSPWIKGVLGKAPDWDSFK